MGGRAGRRTERDTYGEAEPLKRVMIRKWFINCFETF
jgi:hypothetical protein